MQKRILYVNILFYCLISTAQENKKDFGLGLDISDNFEFFYSNKYLYKNPHLHVYRFSPNIYRNINAKSLLGIGFGYGFGNTKESVGLFGEVDIINSKSLCFAAYYHYRFITLKRFGAIFQTSSGANIIKQTSQIYLTSEETLNKLFNYFVNAKIGIEYRITKKFSINMFIARDIVSYNSYKRIKPYYYDKKDWIWIIEYGSFFSEGIGIKYNF